MDISHLLSLPESKTLEFKRDLSSPKPVLRTLVAFANTAGGTLIIGKADDGVIVGVSEVLAEEERLANLISDSIAPAMMPEIEAVTVEDKTLLLVRVAHWPGPFYLKEFGATDGVYVRLGSTNRKADAAMLAELERLCSNHSFDQLPCGEAEEDALDNALIGTGMRLFVSIFSDRLEIQNPGMLPFGMTLEDFKSGVSRVRNRVIAQVLHRLEIMEHWGSGYERIREACRDGGYPEPEWQEMGMCTRVIFRPHPEVATSAPANEPVNEPVNERQRWFMEQLQRGGQVKAEDIMSQWQVSLATAKRDIASLRENGLVEFVGAAKTGSYRLKTSGKR